MPHLFDEIQIGNLRLPNRTVRSATWEGMADENGYATAALADCMAELARGGVGLIILGHSHVSPEGQASVFQTAIHSDGFIPRLTAIANAVHQAGGRIIPQLAHAGCQGRKDLTGLDPIGPSKHQFRFCEACRPMTKEEIARTVEAFGLAAARARKAGFDGIQIHAAHGYCLSQFLSPCYNRREDEYGGSLENRARMLMETVDSVRAHAGEDFPLLVKINCDDYLENGFGIDEMVEVAQWLEQKGVDALEISGGTPESGKKSAVRKGELKTPEDEVYYKGELKKLRTATRIPVSVVGGLRSFEVASHLIESGLSDMVSLSRPLIREPHLVNRWESGDTSRATCTSCTKCYVPGLRGEGVCCMLDKKLREKAAKEKGK